MFEVFVTDAARTAVTPSAVHRPCQPVFNQELFGFKQLGEISPAEEHDEIGIPNGERSGNTRRKVEHLTRERCTQNLSCEQTDVEPVGMTQQPNAHCICEAEILWRLVVRADVLDD